MRLAGDLHAPLPELSEAVERLRAFLAQELWPDKIAWLRPSAVTTQGPVYIVNPRQFRTLDEVAILYANAAQARLGVQLSGLAHDAETSYCYLWYPASPREAEEHLMPAGLKLSLAKNSHPVRPMNGLQFRWRRLLGPPRVLFEQLMA